MEIGTLHIVATSERVAELDRLGDEIAELSAHLDAATARLLDLIREFDARGGWNHGFRSCAHWLSWRVGMELGAAREHVRVARALGLLPRLADAFGRGELSYSKIRALTRAATPQTEEQLIAVGRAGTACHVERIVRGWRRVDRLAEAREKLYRRVRTTDTPSCSGDVPAGTSSMEQQQADALALLAEAALHHSLDPGAPGERYQVVVHVDAPVLADPEAPGQSVLDGGTHVPAENVPAPGVRRDPCDHASRRGRSDCRCRRPHPHDSARDPARAPPSRRRLPLPTRCPTAAGGAPRSLPGAASDERIVGPPAARAHRVPGVAGRGSRRGLGDRCLAPAGREAPGHRRIAPGPRGEATLEAPRSSQCMTPPVALMDWPVM